MHGYLWGNVQWTPQAAIEAEFMESNPWAHAFKHLWPYSLASLITAALISWFNPAAVHAMAAVFICVVMPVYVGCTSHNCKDCPRFVQTALDFGQNT